MTSDEIESSGVTAGSTGAHPGLVTRAAGALFARLAQGPNESDARSTLGGLLGVTPGVKEEEIWVRFPTELTPGENSAWHSAPHSRALGVVT